MYCDKQVGSYRFNSRNLLGVGAQGEVYLGINLKTNAQVAIKCLNKQKIVENPRLREAFLNEVSIVSKMNNTHIIKFIDMQESSNNYYLIFEYCKDGDLKGFLRKSGILAERVAKEILVMILRGFQDLIKNGIIHRDLKPANILNHEGTFKISDFGFSRYITASDKMLQSQVGTPLYMSPQILNRRKYTSKSDIWSLGMIYYECLYGKVAPWSGRTKDELLQKIQLKPLNIPEFPCVSSETKDFLRLCLQVDEEKRISWDEVYSHPLVHAKFNNNNVILDQTKYLLNELKDTILRKHIDIDRLFQKVSVNHKITVMQFHYLLTAINPLIYLEDSYQVFKKIDRDNNNVIELHELREWFLDSQQQPPSSPLTPPASSQARSSISQAQNSETMIQKLVRMIQLKEIDVRALIQQFDLDNDQHIDQDELRQLTKQIDPSISEQDLNTVIIYFQLKFGDRVASENLYKAFVEDTDVEEDTIFIVHKTQTSLSGPGSKLCSLRPKADQII